MIPLLMEHRNTCTVEKLINGQNPSFKKEEFKKVFKPKTRIARIFFLAVLREKMDKN